MEALIGLSKTECICSSIFHQGPYKTLDVEYVTAGLVAWYNSRRLLGTREMVPLQSSSEPTTAPSRR